MPQRRALSCTTLKFTGLRLFTSSGTKVMRYFCHFPTIMCPAIIGSARTDLPSFTHTCWLFFPCPSTPRMSMSSQRSSKWQCQDQNTPQKHCDKLLHMLSSYKLSRFFNKWMQKSYTYASLVETIVYDDGAAQHFYKGFYYGFLQWCLIDFPSFYP